MLRARLARARSSGAGRFVAAVLMTTGALLVADVVATLTWQEPVSAVMAARAQGELERQLRLDSQQFARTRDSARRPRPAPGDSARAFAGGLERGRAFARIVLPTLDRSYVVVEGTDSATLRKGPGHYPGSGVPGSGRTVALAGHRTTYGAPFAAIDELERGQPIVLAMPYGRFTYEVEDTRISTARTPRSAAPR